MHAFQIPPQARLGANYVFSFLLDDDPASSSNRIGAMLTRLYGSSQNFVDALQSTHSGSRLIVFEDALWTGTEVCRLLKRLVGGDLRDHALGKRILFRYCVVSDYGLRVFRHFVEHNGLQNVDLLLDDRQRFVRVLGHHVDETLVKSQWNLSPKEFDEWLLTEVNPMAFQSGALWGARREDAQRICERIGADLVERYVSDHQKNWSVGVKKSFALGAGRFACVLAFAHSVPKVCLPLLWLGGRVAVDPNTSIDWKPLLYDARRTLAHE